jgi:hypothetical protein
MAMGDTSCCRVLFGQKLADMESRAGGRSGAECFCVFTQELNSTTTTTLEL